VIVNSISTALKKMLIENILYGNENPNKISKFKKKYETSRSREIQVWVNDNAV
jgi:hypothetical protein